MQLEIEQKYPIDNAGAFAAKLERLGTTLVGTAEQVDTYYNHPCRNFAATDEAVRIRRIAGDAYITYKGPRIESETKTRRELELPLSSPDDWHTMLEALGFIEVATVKKQRQSYSTVCAEFDVTLCIDEVDGLGAFAEIEILASESDLDQAKAVLRTLEDELQLAAPERRSYLEMILP